MARRFPRTSIPIALGTITVPLTVAILVGWTIVVARSPSVTGAWLLVLGIISLSIIITALVLLSAYLVREMLAAQRQFGFIDSVTHELKSPLASLKLGLETLRRPDLPQERTAELVGMMLADVDRLSGFIGDVLQANRMAHGTRLNQAELPLRALTERVVQRVIRRHGADGITIDIDETLHVRADATALDTVLTNLVDNAVKYSDPPPRVRVSARRLGSRVELLVRDEGIGLEKGQLRRVLQRFYRVDSEAVRRRSGTGLGLHVALVLTHAMGGRLRLESEGPGRGTTARLVVRGVAP